MKKNKNLKLGLTCLLSLLIFFVGVNFNDSALSSNIPQVPTQDIFVQDYANMIDENSKSQLLKMSEDARSSGTAELAIVTISSLNGYDIKEYSNTLFRTWGIGNKDTNNGLLVLLVNDTKQIRIEVGKGLEGNITDAKAGDVIRTMAPHFKDGKFGEGLIVGHQALTKMISSESTTLQTVSNSNEQSEESLVTNDTNQNTEGSIVSLLFIFGFGAVGIYLIHIYLFGKSKKSKFDFNVYGNDTKDTNTVSVDLEKNKIVLSQHYTDKILDTNCFLIKSDGKPSNINTTSKTNVSAQSKSRPKTQPESKQKQSTNNGYNNRNNYDNDSYYNTPSYTPSYETKSEDSYSSSWDSGSSFSDFGGGSSDGGGSDGGW